MRPHLVNISHGSHHQPSRLPSVAYPAMCARREIPLADRMAEWASRQAGGQPSGVEEAAAPAEADELDEDLDVDDDVVAGDAVDDVDDDLDDDFDPKAIVSDPLPSLCL